MMGIKDLKKRMSNESGIAVPVVVAVIGMVTTLSAVGAASAIKAQSQSRHDRDVKRALAAAQAGLDVAVYRLNMMAPQANQCVEVAAGTSALRLTAGDVATAGWCTTQPAAGEALADGARYSYRVSLLRDVQVNGVAEKRRSIVSSGSVNGVTRRLAVSVLAQTDVSVFGNYAIQSLSKTSTFEIDNDAKVWENCNWSQPAVPPTCEANVYSAGQIRISGNNGVVCGDASDSDDRIDIIGGRLNPTAQCPAGNTGVPVNATSSVNVDRPSSAVSTVDHMLQIPSSNDNCRLQGAFNGQPFPCAGDSTKPRAFFKAPPGPDGSIWDGNALVLKGNAQLHLTGGDYVLCYVQLGQFSKLIVEGQTRIWLKDPQNCPTGRPPSIGTQSFETWGSFVVASQGADVINDAVTFSSTSPPDVASFQIWMQGSDNPSMPTFFRLSANQSEDDLAATVFAPRSDVYLGNEGDMTGAVVGRTVKVTANFKFKYVDTAREVVNPVVFARVQRWTECKARTNSLVPDEGCNR